MNSEFEFEYWLELAESDPDAFEDERSKMIETVISSSPAQYQHRLRQTQWKIDTIRQVSPNPLASCMRIYDLLMDKAYGDKGFVNCLENLVGNLNEYHEALPQNKKNQILELKPKLANEN